MTSTGGMREQYTVDGYAFFREHVKRGVSWGKASPNQILDTDLADNPLRPGDRQRGPQAQGPLARAAVCRLVHGPGLQRLRQQLIRSRGSIRSPSTICKKARRDGTRCDLGA